MVKRIIAGLLLTAFAILMLCIRDSWILVAVIAAICGVATYELNNAVKLQNKPIKILSIVASCAVPFYYEAAHLGVLPVNVEAPHLVALYIVVLCILMLANYEKTQFTQVTSAVIASLGVPFAITRLLYLRDIDEYFPKQDYNENHGLFLLLFAMFCAWMTDVFAFFVGSFLGKHKLCPNISPKKTIEGAVGGVLGCVLANVILYAVFTNLIFETKTNNYLGIILMTVFLSVISICGDLTASVIKRNCEIKDFGKLIPGHGGIIDRFDSLIFVLTAMYAILNIFGVVI